MIGNLSKSKGFKGDKGEQGIQGMQGLRYADSMPRWDHRSHERWRGLLPRAFP